VFRLRVHTRNIHRMCCRNAIFRYFTLL